MFARIRLRVVRSTARTGTLGQNYLLGFLTMLNLALVESWTTAGLRDYVVLQPPPAPSSPYSYPPPPPLLPDLRRGPAFVMCLTGHHVFGFSSPWKCRLRFGVGG